MNRSTLIHLREINKTFYDPKSHTHFEILQGINLDIIEAESLAICGTSGEGKSTLLHLLGLLDKPTSGKISFPLWPEISSNAIRANYMGFIFQSFHLLEDLSVEDNVMLSALINKDLFRPNHHLKQQANELLKLVGLSSRAKINASRLSGGEKQRCAIARALFMKPKILFADEPTGSLDHHTASYIADLLFKVCTEYQISLVLVTHNDQLANHCCKKMRLTGGKVLPFD
jgi:lipoprotein-releasing system ATP-binding protein